MRPATPETQNMQGFKRIFSGNGRTHWRLHRLRKDCRTQRWLNVGDDDVGDLQSLPHTKETKKGSADGYQALFGGNAGNNHARIHP